MMEHEKPEIRFRRELRQNYLMIAAEEEAEQKFEARMLAGNTIEGLLKFRFRREDDRLWFCYEITSRQPLSRLLERTAVTASRIRMLLLGIMQTLTRMEDYLLSETLVLLDPDYIYMDSVEFQPGLCLLPGRTGDFPREFSSFLQFLLGKTDHQDKEAVMMVYGLYQESLRDNYGLNDLMRWLTKEDYSDLEYAYMNAEAGSALPERDIVPAGGDTEVPAHTYAADFSKEPERKSRTGKRRGGALWWMLLPVLAAALLWLWRGTAGIMRYGALVIGGSVGLAAAGAAAAVICRSARSLPGDGHGGGRDSPRMQSWEMAFEEPETVEESRTRGYAEHEMARQSGDPTRPFPEDPMHTVMLRPASPGAELRRLSGIDGTAETIPISYYPFLIGKQESLADYVLKEDTVSRLHARIDRRDETYWLTDLNSTNGTAVNGRALEANETIQLHAGDRVDLADLRFKFE